MSGQANAVNIARAYHHGSLQQAALEAGLRHLEQDGAEDFSLRELARELGVSAPSLYRHYPNKSALLDALAAAGMDRLGAVQRTASEAAGGGEAGFFACGRAYVRFALAEPELFRLMSSRMAMSDPLVAPLEEVPQAIRFLRESIDQLMGQQALAQQRRAAALHAWSLVHGLALLILDGPIPADDALIDATLSSLTFDREGAWAP